MNFELKEIGPQEFDKIQSLAHLIWPETFAEILSAEQMAYMLEMMYKPASLAKQQSNGCIFLLALANGVEVGFASYELNYKKTGKTKIHKLYLLPETQGKGFGRKMIEKIAEIAITNQNTSLILNVNRYNKAYEFYLKTGFIKTGEEDIDIGNGFLMEDFILEKNLIG